MGTQVATVSLVAFLTTSGLIVLFFLLGDSVTSGAWLGGLLKRGGRRGAAGFGDLALSALPRLGAPLLPADETGRTRLQERLILAGWYQRGAVQVFLGVRVALVGLAVLAAMAIFVTGWLAPTYALLLGAILVGLALVAPGVWLWQQTRARQAALRRALPDVLDVITICLEGGLGLPEAIRRVTEELQLVHPLLAAEMTIIEREMLLGLSAGEGLRKFAARSGLSEVRELASVAMHSERYGVSTAQAFRVEADAMRQARQQRAEEAARKAAVLILFPTLLFIFPAIFIVALGPAVYGILGMFNK